MEESPADALEIMMRSAHKRRRAETEAAAAVEPGLELADLSAEMQVRLIEAVESPQAGADPAPHSKLAEAGRAWRWMYDVWVRGRAARLERPTEVFTIALARLFVSPRWKLITHMNWDASSAILRAFEREKFSLVVFFRTARSGWFISYLEDTVAETASSVVRSTITTSHAHPHFGFDESRTIARATGGSATHVETLDSAGAFGQVDAALTYGFAIDLIAPKSAYSIGAANPVFLALRSAFLGPSLGTFRREMLAWQDKVVAMRVVADTTPPPRVLTVFDVEGAEVVVETRLNLEDVLGTLGSAIDAARAAVGDGPGGGRYLRTALKWHNDAIVIAHYADGGWVSDPRRDFRSVREDFEALPEPRLKIFRPEAGRGWRYDGSMFIPEQRGPGLLIMPLPWLFYLAEPRLAFAKVVFAWSVNKTAFLNLLGDSPLTYATHDLVWLPDSLPDEELADLAMLQRRDIRERAVARAPGGPAVEPL